MILNLGSLAFNANLAGEGGNPAWGTELGQGEGYKFVFEDMSDFFTGMVYSSIPDIDKVYCPLGKGGNQRADYDFVVASLFKNVFVNGKRVQGARFILLIVKKIHGDHHVGRRTIKYNPRMTYRGEAINDDCYHKIVETMGWSDEAAWFVHEINIKNQDELHFSAYLLGDAPIAYSSTDERKRQFLSRLPKRGNYSNGQNSDRWSALDGVNFDSCKSHSNILTALRTKPFMLLAGISGTGKSRLVKELAFMTCLKNVEDPDEGIVIDAHKDTTTPFNYCHIEVKPNWHDSSELLGYYNALDGIYELTPFIRFVYRAIRFPEMPFFVCLDEMNLAPVEQYFAEYLSALETRTLTAEGIVSAPLLEQSIFNGVDIAKYKQPSDILVVGYLKENGLKLPNNLYVVGTVNMDDTTHQFSRKVIDRAFTVEMNGGDLTEMFSQKNTDALKYRSDADVVPLDAIKSCFIHAAEMFEDGSPFLKYEDYIKKEVPQYLNAINARLANTPFQVSYRVQNELILYLAYLIQQNNFPDDIDALTKEAVLAVLMEKILPRVQGDDKLLGRGKDKDVFTELKEYVEKALLVKEETEDKTELVHGSDLYRQVTDKLEQMHMRLENSYFANFF